MEILPSGKTGADKFENRATDPNKVLDRLSMRIIAQSLRKFYEVVRGWSYSGDEGSSTAIDDDLSLITSSNIADYESTFTQGLNTLIAFNNTLDVDGSSTASDIVLVPKKISSDVSPNATDYSTDCPLPLKYQDDLEFTFRAIAENPTAVTISIPDLSGLSGTMDLVDESGNDLVGGELTVGKYVRIKLKTISSVKKAILISAAPNTKYNSFKNLLINGAMMVDQRNSGSSQTITAGAALAYTVDRWFAYCTGANVTGQRVSGTTPNKYNYRFTGAASVTKIGFAQRIESGNSQHLAGNTVTLSVDLANSLLTTVTWVAYYANTSDTFGSLASPTKTQFATGTFTVTSTLTRYSTNISIPSAATTGIEIEFSVAAQISGTWTIGRAQLEHNSIATSFDQRSIQQELYLCKRYTRKDGGQSSIISIGTGTIESSTTSGTPHRFDQEMRVTPTASINSVSNFIVSNNAVSISTTGMTIATLSSQGCIFNATFSSIGSITNGTCLKLAFINGNYVIFDAEL